MMKKDKKSLNNIIDNFFLYLTHIGNNIHLSPTSEIDSNLKNKYITDDFDKTDDYFMTFGVYYSYKKRIRKKKNNICQRVLFDNLKLNTNYDVVELFVGHSRLKQFDRENTAETIYYQIQTNSVLIRRTTYNAYEKASVDVYFYPQGEKFRKRYVRYLMTFCTNTFNNFANKFENYVYSLL